MARSTSIQAYNEIKKSGLLSKLRWQVYDYVYHNGPCTAKKIFKELSKKVVAAGRQQPNSGVYTTRCSELRNRGVFQEIKKVRCPDSNRIVILWDVTSALPARVPKTSTRKKIDANLKRLRTFCEKGKKHLAGKQKDAGKVFGRVLAEMDSLKL